MGCHHSCLHTGRRPVVAHSTGWIMCCLVGSCCVERWEAHKAEWYLPALLFLHYSSGWGLMIQWLQCKANGLECSECLRNWVRGLLFVSHKMTSAVAWELISSVQVIPSLNPFLLISLIKNIITIPRLQYVALL